MGEATTLPLVPQPLDIMFECNNIVYSDIKIFDVIQRPYLYPSLSLKHRFCIPKFSQHATKDGKNCSVGRSLGWKEDRV